MTTRTTLIVLGAVFLGIGIALAWISLPAAIVVTLDAVIVGGVGATLNELPVVA